MIRVLYFSTARAHINRAEVDEIVSHASERNAALGITGALAYNGRNFCQLLEGHKQTVHDLLNVIEQDERHAGFKVLDSKEITERHFRDWGMTLVQDLDFSTVINAMQA